MSNEDKFFIVCSIFLVVIVAAMVVAELRGAL